MKLCVVGPRRPSAANKSGRRGIIQGCLRPAQRVGEQRQSAVGDDTRETTGQRDYYLRRRRRRATWRPRWCGLSQRCGITRRCLKRVCQDDARLRRERLVRESRSCARRRWWVCWQSSRIANIGCEIWFSTCLAVQSSRARIRRALAASPGRLMKTILLSRPCSTAPCATYVLQSCASTCSPTRSAVSKSLVARVTSRITADSSALPHPNYSHPFPAWSRACRARCPKTRAVCRTLEANFANA